MQYVMVFLLLLLAPTFSTDFSPESNTVEYGTVEYHSDPKRILHFENTGTDPFRIHAVKSSCGCLYADWPQEKIQPGERNRIKVHYDTKRIGKFSKTLTVYYGSDNQTETSVYILYVKGEVLPE